MGAQKLKNSDIGNLCKGEFHNYIRSIIGSSIQETEEVLTSVACSPSHFVTYFPGNTIEVCRDYLTCKTIIKMIMEGTGLTKKS